MKSLGSHVTAVYLIRVNSFPSRIAHWFKRILGTSLSTTKCPWKSLPDEQECPVTIPKYTHLTLFCVLFRLTTLVGTGP
jgi:hypothetical protein